jgi:hypothetical protein
MSWGNENDNIYHVPYYYLPGKYEKLLPNKDRKREIDIPNNQDNKINFDTCDKHLLSRNLYAYLHSIDIDLKNLHRKWSNID